MFLQGVCDTSVNLAGRIVDSVSSLPVPIDTCIANSLEEHFRLEGLTVTAPYTPTGSPFTSTASTFSTDRTSPFTPSTVSGDRPTLTGSTTGDADALVDVDAQN